MTLMAHSETFVPLADPIDDEALLEQFLAGDDDAFLAIFKRYEKPLIRYLTHVTHQAEIAKDICQETMTRLIQKPPNALQKGALKAWLYRVAYNLAMDYLRKNSRNCELPPGMEEQQDSGSDTGKNYSDQELGTRLRQHIATLPEQMREVICLRVFGGLRFREVAKISGMPLGTVLWRMNKAVGQLREKLETEGWL